MKNKKIRILDCVLQPDKASSFEDLKIQLDKALWTTKGARFKSYSKYRMIHNSLKFLNTLFSFVLIVIAILQISQVITLDKTMNDYLGIVMLILSVYIFANSFYLPLLNERNKTLFKNAVKISYLLRKLKLAKNEIDLENISKQYFRLETSINHDEIDYLMWSLEQRIDTNMGILETVFIKIKWYLYAYFPIIITLLLIIIGYLLILHGE